jgi:hypothetical protein
MHNSKPMCRRSNLRNNHETQSYAFGKFIFMTDIGQQDNLIEQIPSCAELIALWMSRPKRQKIEEQEENEDQRSQDESEPLIKEHGVAVEVSS